MPERRVFSIPLSNPAANTLADYLIETYGERLPQVLVLVPLARAQRTLREALLTRGGGDAMLLPRIEALGNIDVEAWMPGSLYNSSEAVLPPAISSARRVMLLANLIFDLHGTETKWPANMEQAMFLAQALTGLMDDLARYGVPLAALEQLVGEDFADHWQISLDFLGRILEDWPKLLAEIGVMEPVARHDAMTRRLAAHWREHPPGFPVIAAGTTGSIPATAELLEVIAGLPEGGVILHGLDKTLDDRAWDQISATHPQYIIKELLERIGVARHQVTMI